MRTIVLTLMILATLFCAGVSMFNAMTTPNTAWYLTFVVFGFIAFAYFYQGFIAERKHLIWYKERWSDVSQWFFNRGIKFNAYTSVQLLPNVMMAIERHSNTIDYVVMVVLPFFGVLTVEFSTKRTSVKSSIKTLMLGVVIAGSLSSCADHYVAEFDNNQRITVRDADCLGYAIGDTICVSKLSFDWRLSETCFDYTTSLDRKAVIVEVR